MVFRVKNPSKDPLYPLKSFLKLVTTVPLVAMPSTTRSRGGAGVAAASEATSDVHHGNFQLFEPADEISAEDQLASEQAGMSCPLKDLLDGEIVRLRASLTASRKSLDDLKTEVLDQAETVQGVRARNGPKALLNQYIKVLQGLLQDGDKLLNTFDEGNTSFLQRLTS